MGESDLPVMVFIHGGGYMLGEPDTMGGSPLPFLTRDVVLVSLQYRLGTLGQSFLVQVKAPFFFITRPALTYPYSLTLHVQRNIT